MRKTLIIGALLIAGCATATMDGIMQSWQGEHIDQVVKQWGYPNSERDFRGRKLYVWNDSSTYIVPSFGSTTGTATRTGPNTASIQTHSTSVGGGMISGQCERILEVNQSGAVVATQWQGNDCCVMAVSGRCGSWPNPKR